MTVTNPYALCSPSWTLHDEDLELEAEVVGPAYVPMSVRFQRSGPIPRYSVYTGRGLPVSLPLAACRGSLGRLVLASSTRLFRCSWTEDLIRSAAQLVAPGGELILPFRGSSTEHVRGLDERDLLLATGQSRGACEVVGPRAHVTISEPVSPTKSGVFSWFATRFGPITYALIHELPDFEIQPGATCNHPDEVADPPRERSFAGSRDLDRLIGEAIADKPIHQQLENAGLSNGANLPILVQILESISASRSLDILDVGAGPGALLLDLATTRDAQVRIDIWRHVRPTSEVRFTRSTAEEFEPRERYDAISFIGSLLFIERVYLHSTIDRYWECIRPGGALIVKEATFDPTRHASLHYRELILRADEMRGLLERYGHPEEYHVVEPRLVDVDYSRSSAPFRVVRKP